MSPEQREQLKQELVFLKQLLDFHNAHESEISRTTMTPDEHINYRISIMAEIHRIQQLVQQEDE